MYLQQIRVSHAPTTDPSFTCTYNRSEFHMHLQQIRVSHAPTMELFGVKGDKENPENNRRHNLFDGI